MVAIQIEESIFQEVQEHTPDPIFELTIAYNKDTVQQKVNLGAGSYKDQDGLPWVLPSVKAAKAAIFNDPLDHHEYPPIAGLPMFRALAARTIFGQDSPAILEGRIASQQTISGTGANHLAGLFLAKFYPRAQLYVSNPTWANHHTLYERAGHSKIKEYPYWNPVNKSLDFEGMLSCMESAAEGSVFLLHACAHNPTGVDPSVSQWKEIAKTMKAKRHVPLFDSAYQGFASGSLDDDAAPVRLFVRLGFELVVCQSFSKNLGIYAERAGCMHVVARTCVIAFCIATQLADLTRGEISCAPSFGGKIVERVIGDEALFMQWKTHDLIVMAERIKAMRRALYAELVALETPGSWEHIVTQIGMFSYTGLTETQVAHLIREHHAYLTLNGRISVAGLNGSNVKWFAAAIDQTVRTIR